MIRFYDRLIIGLANLAGLIIAAVGLLIVYDVIARNLGWQPPASTVAITEYAMLYFTMASAPYLVRAKGHIVVEILYQRLPDRSRRVLDRFVLVVCIFVTCTVAAMAGLLIVEAMQRNEIEIRSLEMPRALLFLPLAVGFTLMATEFLRLFWRNDSVFSSAEDRREML